jgi:hypothetical protein
MSPVTCRWCGRRFQRRRFREVGVVPAWDQLKGHVVHEHPEQARALGIMGFSGECTDRFHGYGYQFPERMHEITFAVAEGDPDGATCPEPDVPLARGWHRDFAP